MKHHHDTLIRLYLFIGYEQMHGSLDSLVSLDAIVSFGNLQVLEITCIYFNYKEFQHIIFLNLQTFQLICNFISDVNPIIIWKTIGKPLPKVFIDNMSKSINLFVIQSCPNLKMFVVYTEKSEIDLLKRLFDGYQDLERIVIYCNGIISMKMICWNLSQNMLQETFIN